MLLTASEIILHLAARIKRRRIALNLTQVQAAARSGISYATWRRLEANGTASIEDLAKAAIVLQCDADLVGLFPEPIAQSIDELLARSAPSAKAKRAVRSA